MGIYRHNDKETERWVYTGIMTRKPRDGYIQA